MFAQAQRQAAVSDSPAARLTSIDALRGLVMVVMALDHVRDFFHVGAMSFSPTDLNRATPALFMTRWITHFCLPVFMFTAGMGAYLRWRRRGQRKAQLSKFLVARGVWFVFLELTVMQFAYDFSAPWHYMQLLLILWIFGICMLLMAGLIWLPPGALAGFSLLVIAGHDLLDPVRASALGPAARLWNFIHQPGVIRVFDASLLVTYTVLPWIGVMTAGFCLGRVFEQEERARRRTLRMLGVVCLAGFFVLRTVNRYGDPAPWAHRNQPVFTLLSFLNCTKYPVSLDFILMTLGPALLVLAWFDAHRLKPANPLIIFGRVPFFYFVLHFYLIHALSVLLAFVRYGESAARFAFNPPPSMGGPADLFPRDYGYGLTTVYLMWAGLVPSLYPLCRWYAGYRAAHKAWWLSYL